MKRVCQMCGNDIAPGRRPCPFCGTTQDAGDAAPQKPWLCKTINLERGRPFVETAMRRLKVELQLAKNEQISVVTLIHGYGSSGKGGAIGVECRKTVDFLKASGEVKEYIFGEDFSQKSGRGKDMLRRYPKLKEHDSLNKRNRGVTLVLL